MRGAGSVTLIFEQKIRMKGKVLFLALWLGSFYFSLGQSDTVLLDSIQHQIIDLQSDTLLDYTEYFIYDGQHMLVEEFSLDGRTRQKKDRKRYTYAAHHDSTVTYRGDDDVWAPRFLKVLAKDFDGNGSTIEQSDVWDEDIKGWIGDIRFSNYRNEAGSVITYIRENFDEENMRWDTNSLTENFYNDQHIRTQSIFFFRTFSGEERNSRQILTYDDSTGYHIADTTYQILMDGAEELSRRREFRRTALGRHLETLELAYNTSTGKWDSLDRTSSTYNDLGLTIRFFSEEYDTAMMVWLPDSESQRVYDLDSNILMRNLFLNDFLSGEFVEAFRWEWTYDMNGLNDTYLQYRRNSDRKLVPWLLHTYTYNEWDLVATEKLEDYADEFTLNLAHRLDKYFYSDGTVTSINNQYASKPFAIGPNPTTDHLQVSGQNSIKFRYKIYDLNGKLLSGGVTATHHLIPLPIQGGNLLFIQNTGLGRSDHTSGANRTIEIDLFILQKKGLPRSSKDGRLRLN